MEFLEGEEGVKFLDVLGGFFEEDGGFKFLFEFLLELVVFRLLEMVGLGEFELGDLEAGVEDVEVMGVVELAGVTIYGFVGQRLGF